MDSHVVIEAGKEYEHRSGGQYKCLYCKSDSTFVLEREEDCWTVEVYGVYMDRDNKIYWDYIKGGYYKCAHCSNPAVRNLRVSSCSIMPVCENCSDDYAMCGVCGYALPSEELINRGDRWVCENCYDITDELEWHRR